MQNRNAAPKRISGVLEQRAHDTVVLLDCAKGEYFTLDEVGGRIWDLCDGEHSPADMIRVLCAEYDVDATTMAVDLSELLEDLARAGLVSFDD